MSTMIQIRGLSRTPISIGHQRLSYKSAIEVDLDDSHVRKDLERYKGLWFPDLHAADIQSLLVNGNVGLYGQPLAPQYPNIPDPVTQGATYSQSDVQSIATSVMQIIDALEIIGITAL